MTASTLTVIASAIAIVGGVIGGVRQIWKAVSYLDRITRKLQNHEKRLDRLEGARHQT